jgi:ubiquinone/menaquinone biosynthesis C-methylase UbiE
MYMNKTSKSSSWQPVAKWYDKLVGQHGSYFHEHIIIPQTLKLLNLQSNSILLDAGCGQGVLARSIPKNITYTGIDISEELIREAKKRDQNPIHQYLTIDVTKDLQEISKIYSHVIFILSLQNIENQKDAISNVIKLLQQNGTLILILNHPCFRIPRQSDWGIDEKSKLQYRRVNRYLSPLKIPINMHPGQKNSALTWTYHFPISSYAKWLNNTGMFISNIEEWTSDKESIGRASKMENRARAEIPLFLAIKAIKKSK